MNIFILDLDIKKCAQAHCDQHVNKMILESAQILCTALNKKGLTTPYKSTHANHPCVTWVERSYDNFEWLAQLAYALNAEARWRYEKDKDHASVKIIQEIESHCYERDGLLPFVQAMPEEYKVEGDPVGAYRKFYFEDKSRFATWTRREQPVWYESSSER